MKFQKSRAKHFNKMVFITHISRKIIFLSSFGMVAHNPNRANIFSRSHFSELTLRVWFERVKTTEKYTIPGSDSTHVAKAIVKAVSGRVWYQVAYFVTRRVVPEQDSLSPIKTSQANWETGITDIVFVQSLRTLPDSRHISVSSDLSRRFMTTRETIWNTCSFASACACVKRCIWRKAACESRLLVRPRRQPMRRKKKTSLRSGWALYFEWPTASLHT